MNQAVHFLLKNLDFVMTKFVDTLTQKLPMPDSQDFRGMIGEWLDRLESTVTDR